MRKLSKKAISVITGAVVVAAGSGIAYAYWTGGGSGSSTNNSTGDTQNLVIHQTSTVSAMGPGVAAQELKGNFDNPNSAAVYVHKVVASVGAVSKAGCSAADFTIVQPTAVDAQIAAGDAQGVWEHGSIAFNNDPSRNQDACKNATVTINYTVDNT
jgi:hypothetical protein